MPEAPACSSITFTQGGQLRLVDPAGSGRDVRGRRPTSWSRRCPSSPTSASTRSTSPCRGPPSRESLRDRRTEKLKPLLIDQTFIAGIGNIYADEILYDAGLRHDRDVSTRCRRRRSAGSTGRWSRPCTTPSSTAARRCPTSTSTSTSTASPASYQDQLQVYDRDGEACRRCRGTVSQECRSQRQGHVLACPSCQV